MQNQMRFLTGFSLCLILTSCVNDAFSEANQFQLESTAFKNGGEIPVMYTCKGKNINPPLQINNVPAETKRLALVLDDPDAPIGTWQHWLAWNIPKSTTEIPQNNILANAVIGKNSSGKMEYDGPCPPFGEHRYYFRVYALNTKLDLEEGSKRSELDKAMKGHIISTTTLMGRYKK